MSTPELEATLGRSRNVTARHSIESLCLATPRVVPALGVLGLEVNDRRVLDSPGRQ
jgi:hypothetical protein